MKTNLKWLFFIIFLLRFLCLFCIDFDQTFFMHTFLELKKNSGANPLELCLVGYLKRDVIPAKVLQSAKGAVKNIQ